MVELLLGYTVCYSPLVAKSARHICNVLAAKKDESLALTRERYFVSIFVDPLVGF